MHGWGQVASRSSSVVTGIIALSLADAQRFSVTGPVSQVTGASLDETPFDTAPAGFPFSPFPTLATLCPDTRGGFPPQVKTEISVESKHQTLQGLAFPLQLDAQQAIQALKQKKINYIQLVGPIRSSPTPHSHRFLLLPLTLVPLPCPPCPSEAGSGARNH